MPYATDSRSATDSRGPLLFARYAYGPNRLGYCGPDAQEEMFQRVSAGAADDGLRQLATRFEGAYPYLELIAHANGLADPLDRRVVEAYWLGSALLDRVRPRALGSSLEARFRRRVGDEWRWLAGKPAAGARPVHAFHVLNLIPRMGLLRSGRVEDVLGALDSCRIRWGRVLERDGDWLVVNVVPLAMSAGRLSLAEPRPERIEAWRDGADHAASPQPGSVVAVHWGWACETLDARRLAALRASTSRELALANLSL